MVVEVLFFARLREQLGCASQQVELAAGNSTLDLLSQQLMAQGPQWAEALGADNILCAVNQDLIDGDCALHDGDEIAFFPPVTGG